MKKQYLEAGKIVGTHGVKGEMKLEAWADSPESLKTIKKFYLDEGKEAVEILSSRVHKSLLLITVAGVESATQADSMRGKLLYADRKDIKIPEGKYFIADIIGADVYDGNNGQYYGKVAEVFQTGANDVYRIVKDGRDYLFPAVESMIKSTDIDSGRIEVLPIEGIFDGKAVSDED